MGKRNGGGGGHYSIRSQCLRRGAEDAATLPRHMARVGDFGLAWLEIRPSGSRDVGETGRKFADFRPKLTNQESTGKMVSLQFAAKRQQTFGKIWTYERCFASSAKKKGFVTFYVTKPYNSLGRTRTFDLRINSPPL